MAKGKQGFIVRGSLLEREIASRKGKAQGGGCWAGMLARSNERKEQAAATSIPQEDTFPGI